MHPFFLILAIRLNSLPIQDYSPLTKEIKVKVTLKLGAALLLMFALVTTSCTGGGGKSKSLDGIFFRVLQSEPGDINPLRSNDLVKTQMVMQSPYYGAGVIETLMSVDLDTFELMPGLATKYEVSEDRKEFTFTLRKGVKFHDGSDFTAEDVKFSFDAIFEDKYEAFVRRSFYGNIAKVEILDTHLVKFTVAKPYFDNLNILGTLHILPKAVYSKQSKENRLSKTIFGSGPYKLEKWDQGKSLTLVKNENWWGREVPELSKRYLHDRIVFKFVQDAMLRKSMLERGTVDYDDRIRSEHYVKKMNDDPWGKTVFKVAAENKKPKALYYIGLNNNHPIFGDKVVRRAVSHLVNREFLNEKFYYGMNDFATGPFRIAGDYADPSVKPIPFDITKAKSMLNGAGWSDTDKDGLLDKIINGKKTKLSFNLISSNKDTEKMLTVMKEDMKKAGVEMIINSVDWNALVKAKNEKKFDAIIMAWGGGNPDPDPTQIWHSKSSEGIGSNYIDYKNAEVDRLIEEGIKISDKSERIKVFHKIHRLIADDAPYIFLFEPKYELYAVSKRVKRPKDSFNYSIGPQYWSLEAN
jgi:peptide/nickel transport system substrate-binding protein/microcin C transport system substrate-binding protein